MSPFKAKSLRQISSCTYKACTRLRIHRKIALSSHRGVRSLLSDRFLHAGKGARTEYYIFRKTLDQIFPKTPSFGICKILPFWKNRARKATALTPVPTQRSLRYILSAIQPQMPKGLQWMTLRTVEIIRLPRTIKQRRQHHVNGQQTPAQHSRAVGLGCSRSVELTTRLDGPGPKQQLSGYWTLRW